jgi:Carboxypeptidase regulatory-like domain
VLHLGVQELSAKGVSVPGADRSPARAARVGWWMRPGRHARRKRDRERAGTQSLRLPVLTSYRMKRLVFLSFALVLAGSVLANSRSTSQEKTKKGVVTGTVYDVNHALIVSGEVVAQDPEGKEYWATTNTEGVYRFELPLAAYRIEANAPGFCPKRVEVFKVRSSRPVALDFMLEEKPASVLLDLEGHIKRCPQQTMIKKGQPQQDRRSIAE